MAPEPTISSFDVFLAEHAHLIDTLYVEAKCAQWDLSRNTFAESLWRSAEKRFRIATADNCDVSLDAHVGLRTLSLEVEVFLKSLYLEDLALACACSAGIETAWESFVARFRSELRTAARAILRASGSSDEVRSEELADSLYAELYGIYSDSDGRRKSLFEYFHGRSKLSTWLRAVLAQRHVDLLRAGAKTVSLDAQEEDEPRRGLHGRVDSTPVDPNHDKYLSRLDRALSGALADLMPRERMILACYYVDKLTLAEIGRIVDDHESTVSRQLDRIRRVLRQDVTQQLLRAIASRDGCTSEPAMNEAQIELAFEYAVEDWPFDLSRVLARKGPDSDPRDK